MKNYPYLSDLGGLKLSAHRDEASCTMRGCACFEGRFNLAVGRLCAVVAILIFCYCYGVGIALHGFWIGVGIGWLPSGLMAWGAALLVHQLALFMRRSWLLKDD